LEDLQALVEIFVNNGLGVLCVAYMIYFQNTTMKEMSSLLMNISINIEKINERLSNLEEGRK
jgi:formate/nitrite transporter FocA (FNT family)